MKRQTKTLCDLLGPGPYKLTATYKGTDWCALCTRAITVCYRITAPASGKVCVVGCECVTKRHFASQGVHSAELAQQVQEAKKAAKRAATAAERASQAADLDREAAELWAEVLSHGTPDSSEYMRAMRVIGEIAYKLMQARSAKRAPHWRRKVIDKSRVALANALAAREAAAADRARLAAILAS